MRNYHYIVIGTDSIDDAQRCRSKQDAIDTYRDVAEELARYGQDIEATVHIAPCKDRIDEYPDYVLTLGPRGGVRVEQA